MTKIVNIPGSSGKTPFELCDEPYFYSTNDETSTLFAREANVDPLYMEMGYTSLLFFQRLILSDAANGIYQTYPETAETYPINNEYCVIGNSYLIRENSTCSLPFSTALEAEQCLKTQQISHPNAIYVVARLLRTTDWH